MPDPRDFLPPPPWEGLPVPRILIPKSGTHLSREYYHHNPPSTIDVNGKTYIIHMTFQRKDEAEEEAEDIRDHDRKAKVVKWQYGWAVYEEE